MRDQTHVGRSVEGDASSSSLPYFSSTLWVVRKCIRPIGAVMSLGAPRPSGGHGYLVPIGRAAVCAAAVGVVALFFWQIFVTMPHLSILSADTLAFMQKEPQRGVAIYYFSQLVLLVWNDLYAIAAVQGFLLGAVAVLLAYSVRRATGSALLALAALMVCLFKVSLVALAQELASDSLFSTACLALLGAALLLSERTSAARIALFLLFGFVTSAVRSVGAAILWPMVLALALQLWPTQRRALAAIVAGCIGVYGLNATIGFINYGFWAPQAQGGLALICGATFIARENVPTDIPYPRKFAAATAQPRHEYEKASAWEDKYKIIDRYYCSPSWQIAEATLIDRGSDFYHLNCFRRQIVRNDRFKEAAFIVMLHNPLGYLKMAVVKFIAGAQMFSSYSNYPLQAVYKQQQADYRIVQVEDYITQYSQPGHNDCDRPDLLLTLMMRYADDWRTTSLDLKSDLAKPLRDMFDLVKGATINWLFVGESAIALSLATVAILRRKRMGDIVVVLLLLLMPVWGYLLALCLAINPILRYMDATSPFVYIALLVGIWSLFARSVNQIRKTAVVPPLDKATIPKA
jgi:hypothetical protein